MALVPLAPLNSMEYGLSEGCNHDRRWHQGAKSAALAVGGSVLGLGAGALGHFAGAMEETCNPGWTRDGGERARARAGHHVERSAEGPHARPAGAAQPPRRAVSCAVVGFDSALVSVAPGNADRRGRDRRLLRRVHRTLRRAQGSVRDRGERRGRRLESGGHRQVGAVGTGSRHRMGGDALRGCWSTGPSSSRSTSRSRR